MKNVFVEKFGGASVNTAEAVRNVASILRKEEKKRVVVFSAMGKTTNAIEDIINEFCKTGNLEESLVDRVREFHLNIFDSLLKNDEKRKEILEIIDGLAHAIKENRDEPYDKLYDSTVVFGEILSLKIISAYFSSIGLEHRAVDSRKIIKTNDNYRSAEPLWNESNEKIRELIIKELEDCNTIITQGFMAGGPNGVSTTLGREGSDFSAAIIAYCLDAQSLTIWKDVDGLLNADPKHFNKTIKFETIPFREAIELSYYGASIIHPKTIKPLENKDIPLYVKSFLNPSEKGTIICKCKEIDPLMPSYIFKDNQILLSLTPKDFSFITENNLSEIFGLFSRFGIRINLMQNSALSFSLCFDQVNPKILKQILRELSINYKVKYNKGLRLITIRHFDDESISKLIQDYEIIIEQRSRITAQFLVKP